MKKLLLIFPLLILGCDQSLNVSIENNSDKPYYCSPPTIMVSAQDASVPISQIAEDCEAGDSLLLHYWEQGAVNYDQLSDYDYRPVSVINKVCDHSKEIVVQKVVDTINFLPDGTLTPNGWREWDISCIYSGKKEYRPITQLMNNLEKQK